MLRNEKGFTLIEIIAVLVILGVLAAVGIPKYIDMQSQAKISAAQAEVAEMKSTFNLAYGKFLINNGTNVNPSKVLTQSGLLAGDNTIGTAPDVWIVNLTANDSNIIVNVKSRNSDADYTTTGTWTLPPQT